MKTEKLNKTSKEIIEFVIEVTRKKRKNLLHDNVPIAPYLFLTHSYISKEISIPNLSKNNKFLSGCGPSGTTWLGSFYPNIVNKGLGIGTISMKKIRNTEGVLEWFRSGSLKEVSRKLGNSQKTVIDHYLPKPLLASWNTRLIRRYQNLWITVSASNEDYLLDVTDFHNISDLHSFLIDMLMAHPVNSSPLANELHRRFSELLGSLLDDNSSLSINASLSISISLNGLASLYLYSNMVMESGLSQSAISRKDTVTKVSPKQFLELSSMLKVCLPNHKDPKFREVHFLALGLARQKSEATKWKNLLVKMESRYA